MNDLLFAKILTLTNFTSYYYNIIYVSKSYG